jgi:hypothetical protein
VHVYRDDRLVVKWDLEDNQPMEGAASRQLQKLIQGLVEEGQL